jgi:hypothetical protein
MLLGIGIDLLFRLTGSEATGQVNLLSLPTTEGVRPGRRSQGL